MSWLYRHLVRPVLFTQEAEQVHNRTIATLGWASRHESACQALASLFSAPPLPLELFGLRFPNPVGLAAGMDKYAAALPAWPTLGFGFTELGGVTWHPQPGNPAPRVFRVQREQAIINRMGFNNPGAEAIAARLAEWRKLNRWPSHPVGINLGKSKTTPLERAPEDYSNSLRVLLPHADFFVINVSSPNTPNLRQLQDRAALDEILAEVCKVQKAYLGTPSTEAPGQRLNVPGRGKPILVKVAPDLTFEALDEILELTAPREVAGIVATNTTIHRPQTEQAEVQRLYGQAGGLSGRPLRQRSTEVIGHLYRQTRGRLPIIGVGGIFSAMDAWEKITAGASLLQIYTSLVYEGPAVVSNIVTGLRKRLEEMGIRDLREAIGLAHSKL